MMRTILQQRWSERSTSWFWVGNVPPGTTGCFTDAPIMTYPLYRPDFSRRVIYIRPRNYNDFRKIMRQERVTWFYAPTGFRKSSHRTIVLRAIQDGLMERRPGGIYLVNEAVNLR